MKLRPLLPLITIAVFGGVPAAAAVTADPFGPVEVADSVYHPATNYRSSPPFVGSDGSGNVLLGTIFQGQLAVHERCGAGPVTWQRTVLSNTSGGVEPVSVQVAADGTAMAVWNKRTGGVTTHYSVVRPPGGTWGAPQTIVADPDVTFMRLALGDNGDAIAVWWDSSVTVGTRAAVRPAGGTWGAPELITSTLSGAYAVAMSPTGEAVVVYKGSTPGYGFSRFRPVGGPWTAEVEVLRNTFQNTMRSVQVAFDGTGRTVALADFDQAGDTMGWNVGTGGTWGVTDRTFDDDGDPPEPHYDTRLLESLVRHPAGVVAAWSRKPFDQSNTREVVVARLNGTTWDLKVFQAAAGALSTPRLAVNTAGEILVATDAFQGNVNEIYASIAPSLTAAWPALTRVSPLASATEQYREPFVTAGGPAFAIGWGVHGGSDDLTQVISTKPTGALCAATPPPVPTPVPTATATADPDPLPPSNPLPLPNPTPAPTASPAPPVPSAIADFTTLPAASKCVRGRKLTVRFKRPPAGYAAKSVIVKVNAKKVATLKGRALQKPLYLRKLPKRAFTVTVTVTLTTGKGLTERRRYTPCR